MIYKKKKVFSVPMKTWLRNELKEDLINHIFNKSFYGGKMINVIEVKKQVQDFLDYKHQNEWGVWHIYAWRKWAYTQILRQLYENYHI